MTQPPGSHALLTFNDGAVYKGLVVDGEPHGFGVMTLDDGTMYEGYWDRGRRQGLGKQLGRGFEFVGEWDKDTPRKGRCVLPSGTKVTGEFANGEFHGQCDVWYFDGVRHTGLYADGLCHGLGARTFPNGDVMQGIWHLGGLQQGTFYGEIKDGQFTNQLVQFCSKPTI